MGFSSWTCAKTNLPILNSTSWGHLPDTYQVVSVVGGLVGPYTYSDMTGVALKNQVMPQ